MIVLAQNKEHNVIKRDGRVEPYSVDKLRKVLLWAADNQEALVEDILQAISIRINDKIKIEKLYDEVIQTVSNKISPLYPSYDTIARNLYLQKIYKEFYNIKRTDGDYPSYSSVVKKGISAGIYSAEVFSYFSGEELEILGSFIDQSRDSLFTYGGLVLFVDKYCKRYSKHKYLELPQHVYLRIAIQKYYKTTDENKLAKIAQTYDMISNHYYTEATPKMLNSGTKNAQLASCVLMTPADDAWSINHTGNNMGLFSKFSGGLSIDISHLRTIGSSVLGNNGQSSGKIPFIQFYEKVVCAYNQGSSRPGAAIIYFDWWDYESPELIMLKDAGGKDDQRARKLKYAIKWNRTLTRKFLNNEEVILFNPLETPELITAIGEEFDHWYEFYSNQPGIMKRKINARDLAFLIAKVRSETGNLYIYYKDNVDEQRMGETPVYSSNLCCEITIPSSPSMLKSQRLLSDFSNPTENILEQIITPGEIGLCNLCSVNLYKWYALSFEQKLALAMIIVRGMDNDIDYQFYPVKEGELANRSRRPVGIGVSNYANLLASQKLSWSSEGARQFTHELFEELTYCFLFASSILAKERGKYSTIGHSMWAKGLVPYALSLLPDNLRYPLKLDWNALRSHIMTYGVRFSYHFAIAPTQTSGLAISSTEGIDPITELFTVKSGTYDIPYLAPNLVQNRQYYENAFDIDNKDIIELAAIRQAFLDQSQSVSLYYKTTNSASEIINDIIYAESLGVKTLYYLHAAKSDTKDICESCSA